MSSQHDDAMKSSDNGPDLVTQILPLLRHWKLLSVAPLVFGALGYGASFLVTPIFSATTAFLPPQQQSASSAALASLSALTSLAGGSGGSRGPLDQYVSIMGSVTIADRLIDRFNLMQVYDADYRHEARRALADHTTFTAGKKDGIIRVDIDDKDPKRAADLANSYVEELRRIVATLAVTEAQQRRVFFERQLRETKDRLTAAQSQLQATGFDAAALQAEPKAAAEGYARLKAQFTSAEVRLQTLRSTLAETAPEVMQQAALVASLRQQLLKLEDDGGASRAGPDYVSKYREFKYQETLFELYARQFELARADESKEGALIQVLDVAQPPERKSKPRRKWFALIFAAVGSLGAAGYLLLRSKLAADPAARDRWLAVRRAMARGG